MMMMIAPNSRAHKEAGDGGVWNNLRGAELNVDYGGMVLLGKEMRPSRITMVQRGKSRQLSFLCLLLYFYTRSTYIDTNVGLI